jgi:amyloid beta precursor protein binding protein 1
LFPIYLALRHSSGHVSDIKPESNERYGQIAEEVARAKGGELHNISALTGGMVSQEVIKIITKQYIPIDNTCIYDGITSRTQVLRL